MAENTNNNTLLDQLTKEYYKSGFRPRSDAARAWFIAKLANDYTAAQLTPAALLAKEPNTPVSLMGNMFFFLYDAKWKDELPYWDKFPLVIPIDFYSDSFLGINLHYLDYQSRAVLLDKLNAISRNKYLDRNSRLKVTYKLIGHLSKFREVKPCIKKYLYSHVKSHFMKVEPREWDVAIFLPVERFVGEKKEDIWEGNV
jgi:hypothetical protein